MSISDESVDWAKVEKIKSSTITLFFAAAVAAAGTAVYIGYNEMAPAENSYLAATYRESCKEQLAGRSAVEAFRDAGLSTDGMFHANIILDPSDIEICTRQELETNAKTGKNSMVALGLMLAALSGTLGYRSARINRRIEKARAQEITPA